MAIHVATTQQLVHAGIFPSYQTAWRWVNRRLKKDGWKPRYIGGVALRHTGRKVDVYCNGWTPNARTLLHELMLTDELMPFLAYDILRGPKVDQELRPDATVFINILGDTGETHFEIDTGTEHLDQVKGRMESVSGYRDPVVWIFTDEKRMREVMSYSSPNSFFKLYGDSQFFNSRQEVVLQQP